MEIQCGGIYLACNSITVIKSKRMRWVGHVARIGRLEMRTKL